MAAWTTTTLASHILGELNQDRNATGGTVPDRLTNIVQEAAEELYEAHPWTFRTRTGSAITPGGATAGTLDDASTLGTSPLWSRTFGFGWHLLALAMAQEAFGKPGWQATMNEYEAWLKRAKVNNDRNAWLTAVNASPNSNYTPGGLAKQVCLEVLAGRKEDELLDTQMLLAAVSNIVMDCYNDLWVAQPWTFRRVRTTIATVAGTETSVALPDAFSRMDQRYGHDATNEVEIEFTSDLERYDALKASYNTDRGSPVVALVEQYTDTGAVKFRLRFAPLPDRVYTYAYTYLSNAPTIANTATPSWPQEWRYGWHLLCSARAQQSFGKGPGVDRAKGEWEQWYANALSEHNQQLSAVNERTVDGYGDVGALPSSHFGGIVL